VCGITKRVQRGEGGRALPQSLQREVTICRRVVPEAQTVLYLTEQNREATWPRLPWA
jgi:hypothetical protein